MGVGADGGPPLGWWSPDPRGVLLPGGCGSAGRCARPAARSRRGSTPRSTRSSRRAPTPAGTGAGSPPRSPRAYAELHRLGWAHSVETWRDGELVGGLYGLAVGGLFAGESMFHHATDASKVALVALAEIVFADGDPRRLIDVQWATPHLESLGVRGGAARGLLPPPRGGAGAAPARAVEASAGPCGHRRLSGYGAPTTTTNRWYADPSGSTSSATVRSSWPRIRHHAGTSWPRGRVGGQQRDDGAGGGVAGGGGEPDHRQRTAQAAGVDLDAASQAGRPELGADGRHRVGQHREEPLHLRRRGRRHGPSGRVTRTLPWVSTPIAARTWLGSSVLEVQAEPEATANPRRSSSPTAPRRRRTGRRRSPRAAAGRPGRRRPRCRGCRATTARIRSTRAAARACSVARDASVCCQASAAARARATTGSASVRPPSSSLAGPGRRHRVRSGTTSTPTPPGPPHERASPASTSYAVGGASRPSEAWRPPAAAHRGPGRAAAPAPAAAACPPRRWPPAPPRPPSPARPGRGRAPRGRPGPGGPPGPPRTRRVAGRGREVAAEGEDGGVLDGRGDQPGAPAAPGVQQPLAPGSQRDRARGQERQLGRPHAQPGRDHLAGPVQQRARLPPLGVEAARVGPSGVERGQQRVAGGGQQRSRRRVQQRAARRTLRSGGHTVTVARP